jgi:hypothetical protein
MAKLQVELDVIDRGTKVIKDVGKEFNGLQSKIMAFGKAVAGIFAGGVIVRQLTGIAQAAIDFGDSITDGARKLGLTKTTYQEIGYLAKQSGVEVDGMSRAFIVLAQQAAKSNKILDVSTRDSNGNLKDMGTLFKEVVLRLAEIPSTTERAAAAQKIFGKNAQDVFNIASQGKERISELIGETSKYGLILSDSATNQLHEAKEAQERLNLAWKVASANIVTFVIPAMEAYLPLLQKAIDLMPGSDKIKAAEASAWTSSTSTIKSVAAQVREYQELIKVQDSAYEKQENRSDPAKYEARAKRIGDLIVEITKLTGTNPESLFNLTKPGGFESLLPNAGAVEKNKNAPSQFDDLLNTDKDKARKKALEEQKRFDKQFMDDIKKSKDAGVEDLKTRFEKQKKMEDKTLAFEKKMGQARIELDKEISDAKDKIEEEELENQRLRNEMMVAEAMYLGEAFGAAVASGIGKGKDGLKITIKETLNVLISAIEKYTLAAVASNTLQNVAAEGYWGLLVGAAEATGIVAVAEAAKAGINQFASGTPSAPGGLALIGERGPELMNIPRGAQIFNNQQTTRMLNSGNSNVTVHIHGKNDDVTETLICKIRSGESNALLNLIKQNIGQS